MRFVAALEDLPTGFQTGSFDGQRYGVRIERPVNGRVTKVFAEAFGGSDVVSFNLFSTGKQTTLRPCEMSSEKVKRFILGFTPDKQVARTR